MHDATERHAALDAEAQADPEVTVEAPADDSQEPEGAPVALPGDTEAPDGAGEDGVATLESGGAPTRADALDPDDAMAFVDDEPDALGAADFDEGAGPTGDDDEPDDVEDAPGAEPPAVTFADLGLSEQITRAVAEAGYVTPTPIQEQAIPVVLQGRDVLGCAQTGTGKTAGFTLPMLDILASGRAKARMPRSLILEPTRELALQVAENFVKYGRHLTLTHALLIGGESMDEQRAALDKGVDVLIATPGRLIDLFERGRILLADCKVLVIDEADRMLDMGFIPDVERIVSLLPRMRQTLFFSATMAPEIRRLADAFLTNPREISVSAPATVATTITAGLAFVREDDKREALRRLVQREAVQNALVFCNRKVDVDILYKSLKRHGFSVGALHGDMDQPTRFATLNRFKAGELQLLVCSDVAARGLDIGGLSHVFNFDVPFHAEDYVHRIGRTGRAGREGAAFTLAVADDARSVAAIEVLTGRPIPRIVVEGLEPVSAEEIEAAARRPRGRGRGGSSRGGSAGGGGERRPASAAVRPGAREAGPRDGGRSGAPRDGARDAGRDGARDGARDGVRAAAGAAPRGPEPRRERGSGERGGTERGGGDRGGSERGGAGERAPLTRDARPPYRGDASRSDPGRGDAGRGDAGRGDVVRGEAGRGDDRRPSREDHRRRDRDDLGPPVRGFGDAVPAFMLIPSPRPRRDLPSDDREQEAA